LSFALALAWSFYSVLFCSFRRCNAWKQAISKQTNQPTNPAPNILFIESQSVVSSIPAVPPI
jgi:hypothetical protein